MMISDFLTRLQKAVTNEERDWIALDVRLNNLPPEARSAVWAAAVPHWFDARFLAALLEKSEAETEGILSTLTRLTSITEQALDRGFNIHERSRMLLLDQFWRHERKRYRQVAANAASFAEQQDKQDSGWRIEAIYHLLIADPERGIKELNATAWEWHHPPNVSYEKIEALTRLLHEHVAAQRLTESALGWVLFWEALVDYYYSRLSAAKDKLVYIEREFRDDPQLFVHSVFRLGETCLLLGEYDFAVEQYNKALPLYRQTKDYQGEANCITALGDIENYRSDYPAARASYKTAIDLYRLAGDHRGEASCIRYLGDVHQAFGEWELARAQYEKSLDIERQIGDRRGEAGCIRALGELYRLEGRIQLANEQYVQALLIYREIRFLRGEAHCLWALGELSRFLYVWHKADSLYQEALTIYQKIGLRRNVANCLRSLGHLNLLQGDFNAAEARFSGALDIFVAGQDPRGEAELKFSMAALHRDQGKLESAQQLCEEARLIFHQIGRQRGEGNCIWLMGEISLLLDQTARARSLFEQVRAIYARIGYTAGEQNCFVGLADLDGRAHSFPEAHSRYQEALSYYQSTGMIYNTGLVLLRLSSLAEAMEDFVAANRHREDAERLLSKTSVRRTQRKYTSLDILD